MPSDDTGTTKILNALRSRTSLMDKLLVIGVSALLGNGLLAWYAQGQMQVQIEADREAVAERLANLPTATEVALVKQQLLQLSQDDAHDASQDRQLCLTWKKLSWAETEIHNLQARAGVPITAPDMDCP